MPAFFAHRRGSVVRVTGQNKDDSGLLPFRIVMDGFDLQDPNPRAIITQAGIVEKGSYQFHHTLNQTIYSYVFGDRIGDLRISGICFTDVCFGGAGAGAGPSFSGIKQIADNYKQNKISKRGTPVQVAFGEVNLRAFLVGMQTEIVDVERLLGQWTYQLKTFPED